MDNEESVRQLAHWLCVSFLSVLAGDEYFSMLKEEADEKQKNTTLGVLALGGFLHDIGLRTFDTPERNSKIYVTRYNQHSQRGYEIIKDARIFESLKYIIKDGHKPVSAWSSRYDNIVHVVETVNDFANLTIPDSVLVTNLAPEASPEGYSPLEARLIMLDRTRKDIYNWEDVNIIFKALSIAPGDMK
jgi:hypothetical protein